MTRRDQITDRSAVVATQRARDVDSMRSVNETQRQMVEVKQEPHLRSQVDERQPKRVDDELFLVGSGAK